MIVSAGLQRKETKTGKGADKRQEEEERTTGEERRGGKERV